MNCRQVISLFFCLTLAFAGGCKEQTHAPVTQPATKPSAPLTTSVAAAPPLPPAEPKRPKHPWVIFRDAQREDGDADITATWTGGNRIEINTENVRLLTLDLNKLPEAAPRRGPWNLQIDKQGIEIYGRPGMRVLDLLRSRNGDWSVVPDSHRTKP